MTMADEEKSPRKSLEQDRARAAWGFVEEAKEILEKYAPLVKGFPATINNNGLGQSLAFLFSKKGNNAERLLLTHLEQWLTKSDFNKDIDYYARPYDEAYREGALLEVIQKYGSSQYILATQEALTLLNYLRRFAAGMVENTPENKEG